MVDFFRVDGKDAMRDGRDADQEARVLVLRGLDFDAIVERLEREWGLGRHSARAAAARALNPNREPAVSLRAELAALAAWLDRAR